jgi:hypothetical protein
MSGLMISQREGISLLTTLARPRLTPRLAEGLPVSGFAGHPIRLGSVNLYNDAAVRRLAETRPVAQDRLPTVCSSMLVVRVSARPGWSSPWARLTHDERIEPARGPFWFSPGVRMHLSVLLARQGFVPVVTTVASYVLGTANVIDGVLEADGARPRLTRLTLGPPGDWSDALRGHRLLTPPGNRWLWWTPRGQPSDQPAGQAAGSAW